MSNFPSFGSIRDRMTRRRARRAVVLLYHRIATPGLDPWSLCVTPERFASQIEVIARYADVMSVDEMIAAIAAEHLPRRSIAVTFDDGYADNLHAGVPVLERHGVPATVFCVSGAIGSGREFWWDELQRLILSPDAGSFDADEILRELQVEAAGDPRRALFDTLWTRLRPMRDDTRRSTLDAIAERIPAPPPDGARPMTREELVELADRAGMSIGAHTVTHAWLAGCDAESQRMEVRQSRARLEELTGQRITCFAYPYGDRGAYDATTVAAIRAAGFDAAFINAVGFIDRDSPILELPRLYVKNWTAEEFERRLHWTFDAR